MRTITHGEFCGGRVGLVGGNHLHRLGHPPVGLPCVHIVDSAMDAQPIDIAGYFLCHGEVSTLFTQQVSGFFIA